MVEVPMIVDAFWLNLSLFGALSPCRGSGSQNLASDGQITGAAPRAGLV